MIVDSKIKKNIPHKTEQLKRTLNNVYWVTEKHKQLGTLKTGR